MNHEGLFWVGVTKGGGYINSKREKQSIVEEKIAEGLTYDEARALILSMGYETATTFSASGTYERFER